MRILRAFGHSWVAGAGATRPHRGFAALAAAGLGLDLDNRAVSGSVSSENARAVAADPPDGAALFVVMAGLNDARRHGLSEPARRAYAESLRIVLKGLAGSPIVAIAQPRLIDYSGYAPFDQGSDDAVEAFNDVLRQVAADHGEVRIGEVPNWDPETMLAPDAVHPNDLGHECLARAVVRQAW